jgi:tetratricopeptide (TPR) repeat protein
MCRGYTCKIIIAVFLFLRIIPAGGQPNIDSLLKVSTTATGKQKFLAFKQLSKAFQQTNPPRSVEYAEKQRIVSVEMKDKSLEAEALNDIAVPLMMMQENKRAILLLQECNKIYDSLGDISNKAMAVNNMGIAWSQIGAYEKSLECYLEAIKYYQKSKNNLNLGRTYMSLGLVYLDLKKYDQALEAETKAKKIFIDEKNEKMIANVTVNLGMIYLAMGNYNEAESLYLQALQYYNKNNNVYSQALTRFNIAQMYKKKGSFIEAIRWYNRALPLIRSMNNSWAEANIMYDLSQISIQQGDWKKALRQLDSAELMNKKSADFELQSQISYAFYKIHDSLGNYQLALKYYNNYDIFNDSLISIKKTKVIEELSIRFESEQKEIENKLLKQRINSAKTLSGIVIGSFIAILLISLLTIIILIQKRKNLTLLKNQAEKEKAIQQVELEKVSIEKQLSQEALEKAQMELQLKEQDLMYHSLQKLDLQNINRSVQEKLQPFAYKFSAKKDQTEFLNALNNVTRDAQKESFTDFDATFSKLNKSFFESLLHRCPTLTKTELQVCAMLRTNLSSKDIARLLNISPSSVDMTRYRIRQKLELDQKENLTTFLMTI